MLSGEIFRYLLDKAFYPTPKSLDAELARLERIAGGPTHSLHLHLWTYADHRPVERWLSAAFDAAGPGEIGLPTEYLRPRASLASPNEVRELWDWMRALKASRGTKIRLEQRYWSANSSLTGEALLEHNLARAFEVLAGPLASLRAEAWQDDRGPGGGINLFASIASSFPDVADPVIAQLYSGHDTAEERKLVQSWAERTASAHKVPFRFN